MNISGANLANTYAANLNVGTTGKKSSKSKIRQLEAEKRKLEQQIKQAKNPFSLEKSKESNDLESQVKKLEQQIQTEKIKENREAQKKDQTNKVNSANTAKSTKNTKTNDSDENSQAAAVTADGDSYTPSQNKTLDSTKGIYKVEMSEGGQQALTIDYLG